MIFRNFVSLSIVFALSLFVVPSASAHGNEPRLEISVERVNPGGVVEVRGVDFDYEQTIALSLMRSNIQIPLMQVTTDIEGTFTQSIVLPADLPLGEYNFLARTDHHIVTSSIITVWGVAVQDQEDNGIRDQSDVQLEPMLTVAPGISSTPLPQTTALETPVSRGSSTTLLYSVLLGLGIIVLLSITALKKR